MEAPQSSWDDWGKDPSSIKDEVEQAPRYSSTSKGDIKDKKNDVEPLPQPLPLSRLSNNSTTRPSVNLPIDRNNVTPLPPRSSTLR